MRQWFIGPPIEALAPTAIDWVVTTEYFDGKLFGSQAIRRFQIRDCNIYRGRWSLVVQVRNQITLYNGIGSMALKS